MNYARLSLYILLALLVALLAGYLWGRSGRAAAEKQLADTTLRLDVAEARAGLLAARLDLSEKNFGQALQRLEAAKMPLRDAAGRMAAEHQDAAARLNGLITRVEQAQQQVGKLDLSADTALAETIKLLEQLAPAGK